MQRSKLSAVILLVTVFFFSAGFQSAIAQEVDWQKFSTNLVKALKSDNTGLKRSAMYLVIKYGDKVNVNEAVFDVMRVFRNSDDEKERQLALVTLHKMNNEWAMGFLKRHLKFEDNAAIKHQIHAIVAEYYKTDDTKVAVESKE